MSKESRDIKEKELNLRDLPLEDKHNLVDFFALLIKVDKRINPELYKRKNDG